MEDKKTLRQRTADKKEALINKVRTMEVKNHFSRNKERYISAVAVIVVGGVGVAYGKRSKDTNSVEIEGSNNNVSMIGTQNNYNEGQTRLSYIVTDGERWWDTQTAAGRDLGENPQRVSEHINHGKPLACGVDLERVGVRS